MTIRGSSFKRLRSTMGGNHNNGGDSLFIMVPINDKNL